MFKSIILTIIVVWGIFALLPVKESGTITLYFKFCDDWVHDLYSCSSDVAFISTAYKVDYDKQWVVSQTTSARYDGCSVYNVDNWSCKGRKVDLSMSNGRLIDRNDSKAININGKESVYPKYLQTSALAYYVFKLKSLF
ncbi:MAG: hypothetical protein MK052_01680 [Alphaproteobacteria bacterium]|nr:hypothetical protein [Alphaproteobacteria bacterium]